MCHRFMNFHKLTIHVTNTKVKEQITIAPQKTAAC